MIVIDATNLILGRMATFAAKQALLGHEVKVINAEKAIISGRRSLVINELQTTRNRGIPRKGPYFQRKADRFVRKTIRGMLPYKVAKGAAAYKRVLCFIGSPEEFKDITPTEVAGAKVERLATLNYVHVGDVLRDM